jgi:hypothetical protein
MTRRDSCREAGRAAFEPRAMHRPRVRAVVHRRAAGCRRGASRWYRTP